MLAGHDHHHVQLVWLVASAFGIAALVALIAIYRRATRRYEIEQADQVIDEHGRD